MTTYGVLDEFVCPDCGHRIIGWVWWLCPSCGWEADE